MPKRMQHVAKNAYFDVSKIRLRIVPARLVCKLQFARIALLFFFILQVCFMACGIWTLETGLSKSASEDLWSNWRFPRWKLVEVQWNYVVLACSAWFSGTDVPLNSGSPCPLILCSYIHTWTMMKWCFLVRRNEQTEVSICHVPWQYIHNIDHENHETR